MNKITKVVIWLKHNYDFAKIWLVSGNFLYWTRYNADMCLNRMSVQKGTVLSTQPKPILQKKDKTNNNRSANTLKNISK